jgi:acyl carrier protein
MSTCETTFGRVTKVLIESLNVDEADVAPEASLQNDLGAESIDFLDIVFRLEREFNVQIPRGELFPESVFQGDPAFVSDGRVTDSGMAELRLRMPFANLSGLDEDRRLSAIPDVFTADLVTRYITWKISNSSQTGS